jgi:hypothetical protein
MALLPSGPAPAFALRVPRLSAVNSIQDNLSANNGIAGDDGGV